MRRGERSNLITCPRRGAVYNATYGRTMACGGCPSNINCSYSKCPQCGHEFPLRGGS